MEKKCQAAAGGLCPDSPAEGGTGGGQEDVALPKFSRPAEVHLGAVHAQMRSDLNCHRVRRIQCISLGRNRHQVNPLLPLKPTAFSLPCRFQCRTYFEDTVQHMGSP
ncbi:unnamed protein product [Cyprideis torosa]|uniref:Uncharacterized protein n=1 Tax=Cyprideis torosa TaxID=163714 RepID=A0A7R8WPS0_9CRUS|nr:unnamed protein product [Cyprideis torosa]CAG0907453.1 unnamed protein product [Cyprideis torosa]